MEALAKFLLGVIVVIGWFLSMLGTMRIVVQLGTKWNSKNAALFFQMALAAGFMLWFLGWFVTGKI